MGQPQVRIDVDDDTGVWRVDGMPMILVPQHFFVNNHKAVEQALGRPAYAAQLREAGYRSAYYWCEAEAATHHLEGVDVFHHYMKRLSQRGWGLFQVQHVDAQAGTARVRVDNSVFVNRCRDGADLNACYMFLGWLVGALEYVGKEVGHPRALCAREAQCAAEAGRDYCLFEVTPA